MCLQQVIRPKAQIKKGETRLIIPFPASTARQQLLHSPFGHKPLPEWITFILDSFQLSLQYQVLQIPAMVTVSFCGITESHGLWLSGHRIIPPPEMRFYLLDMYLQYSYDHTVIKVQGQAMRLTKKQQTKIMLKVIEALLVYVDVRQYYGKTKPRSLVAKHQYQLARYSATHPSRKHRARS